MGELENFNKGQYNSWIKSIKDKENRKYLINKGEYYAQQMLKNKNIWIKLIKYIDKNWFKKYIIKLI